MIGIIDYGAGNIKSVKNALRYLNGEFCLTNNYKEIEKFDKIILPGVGAFAQAMDNLKNLKLDGALREFAQNNKPIFGICLGMQLLFEKSSEFGFNKGLGILSGEVVRFSCNKKIPHAGWNLCKFTNQTPINKELKEAYFYFVHSYHVICEDEITLAKTEYGYEFTSAVAKNKIFGFQPHPEKSHNDGLLVLKNFVEM